ncbi:hypothetical protein JZ751_013735 [Albula glossodonta]|uniref:THAP4-like heme-binding domain-containing protein n=1 Tax=Albula glossodonta TaxID=121402 RepID=A0A8T2NVM4_9TELE|nr:hypothetical protein JZ751_013735 [Albula glossodonta]
MVSPGCSALRVLTSTLPSLVETPLNPAVLALDWLLGSWESDEPGEGSFPTIPPFRYSETLHFTHVGQPVINFMFNAFHAESKKPLHRECGFIRLQPGTNRVAFIIAQNSGLLPTMKGGAYLSSHILPRRPPYAAPPSPLPQQIENHCLQVVAAGAGCRNQPMRAEAGVGIDHALGNVRLR